jgi:threonine aldolase
VENTCNKGGGSYYTLGEVAPITQLCREKGLKLHLDGARLFNALVETGESTLDWGNYFDTISVCFSKGLGAPVGSALVGDKQTIAKARRFRKVMGGGMRQAGYLAAACEFALDHHIDKLKKDNDRAKKVAGILQNLPDVEYIKPVYTNILIFKLKDYYPDIKAIEDLKKHHILASPFGDNTVRFVFHSDISEDMFLSLVDILPHALKS